jgi:DNA-binding CsgD family transcriptional regulator
MTPLCSREREVLILTLVGCTIAEIGARLQLSPRTVEDYRRRLLEKYEVKGVQRLVLKIYAEAE